MGFKNLRDCLGYRLVVKNIERTGDHAVIIAKDLLEFKKPIKKEVLIRIQEMSDHALSFLDEACLALFKEDFIEAEKLIKKTSEITKFEKKVLDSAKSIKNDEETFRVRRMIENIRRIAEYASDITEIVLNMNVEKILKKPKL
jgi:phosphate uptake regulator